MNTEVESFLNERVTGFEIHVGKDGASIGLCRKHYNKLHYKHCRSILARMHTPLCVIDHASLLKIKNSLQAQVSLIRSKSMKSTDFLALETALNLANQLETNEVVLLLDVYSNFQGRLRNHALLHTSVSMPKVPGQ